MADNRWRLLRNGPLPGPLNMALDEVLLEQVAAGFSPPVLRLYRWATPTLTLGYFQQGRKVVNQAYCQAAGIEVVRRLTGGRAVLHDQEVTYAVIASLCRSPFFERVLDNYQRIAQVLAVTLEGLGLEVELVPRHRRSHAPGALPSACFMTPSNYELLCRGCKISGSSQKRQGPAFLQHGSLPVDLDTERLFSALDNDGRVTAAVGGLELAQQVGWINRFLSVPVTIDQVEARLLAAFSEHFEIDLDEAPLSAEEWRAAEALVQRRYGRPGWNFLEG